MPLRLKGQETDIRMLRNGSPTQVAKATSNFSMTDELEVLEEEYIGETTSRYDDIYKGTSFNFEIHLEDGAPFDLRTQAIGRAQRRGGEAAARFDIAFVGGLPDGTIKSLTLVDVKFGSVETTVGGRSEFVTMKFEGSCSSVQTIDA